MQRSRKPFVVCGLILMAGCTTPDLSAEVRSFSTSVQDVSADYRQALAIGPDAGHTGKIAALVADRSGSLQLSEDCFDRRADVSACVIDETGLTLPEGSLAGAAGQLDMLSDYFTALDLLVTSKGPTDIQNAAALALDSVTSVSTTLAGGGASTFAGELSARRTGISQVAGFLAEQNRYRKLRQIVAQADPAIERLVLSLIDTSISHGIASGTAAEDRMDAAQAAMDEAQSSGTDAGYEAAILRFLAAHQALVTEKQNGLAQRLRLIRQTHAALLRRLSGPPSPEEVVALIERLKSLQSGLEGDGS